MSTNRDRRAIVAPLRGADETQDATALPKSLQQ